MLKKILPFIPLFLLFGGYFYFGILGHSWFLGIMLGIFGVGYFALLRTNKII